MVKLEINTTPIIELYDHDTVIEELINDIDDAIDIYVAHTQKTPYIFMNSELANDLIEYNKEYLSNDFLHQFYNLRSKYNHCCSQGMLLGCKVYYDDDLNYGEIELR